MGSVFGRRTNAVAIFIAGAIFFMALGFFLATGVDRPTSSRAEGIFTEGQGVANVMETGPDFSRVAKQVREAIVSISAEGRAAGRSSTPNPHGDDVPELPDDHPAVPSEGSGFIISEEGYILTNYHVVNGGGRITVEQAGGQRYDAEIVGYDTRDDIALLKVEPEERLPVALLGDSEAMELGDWVMAMGNPLGFEYSATVGIVSGKGRQLPSSNFRDFIQTDAAIYPGNSGGPLFNLAGEVIGINTAVIPDTNLGFAVPINTVKDILPQLLESGRVVRGYLGVTIGDVRELQERPAGADSGAVVEAVHEGSPAESAGLVRGDVIVSIDGREVVGASELTQVITSLPPGTVATLTVVRDGEREDIDVTLETLPTTLE
jgi:serine protease Do